MPNKYIDSVKKDGEVYNYMDSEARSQINAMASASATDVDKALSPKTVSNGKVTEWQYVAASSDPMVIAGAVEDWLDNHPEATTTVQDGSITRAKLNSAVVEDINGKAPAIVIDSGNLYYHDSIEIMPSILINGDNKAFRTVKYADKKNIYPTQSYSQTKAGVEIVGDGHYWTLNGTATASSTYNATYEDFDPAIPAGTYTLEAYVDIGDSILGNDGMQFGITAIYSDNTSAQINTYIKNADKTQTITFAKDVKRIQAYAGLISGYVFDGYKAWFGLFDSDVTIVDTEETLENGETYELFLNNLELTEIDTCMHTSHTFVIADTKQYIDNKEAKLTYIAPEKFGAIGDGVTNDYAALTDCIAYAIANGIPIRGYGKYFTDSGIVIEGDDLDIEFNQIITTTSDTAAVTLTGYRNKIRINYLYAYSGNCYGFYLYGKLNHWSEFNEIDLPCIYAKQDAIRIDVDQQGAYACMNVFHTQYIRSSSADCIRSVKGYGENVFYGGGKVICPNGWAINESSGCNKYYNFALESDARSGIVLTNSNQNWFKGFRIAEVRGTKTPTSGDVGTLIKFVGTSFANVFETPDVIGYIDIDVSEATPNDELTQTQTNEASHLLNVIRGTGIRSNGFMEGQDEHGNYYATGYYTTFGREMFTLRNHKIIVPLLNYTMSVSSNIDFTGETIPPLPTRFKIMSSSTIKLCDSYCCIGYNEIIIDQTTAKCTIYDKEDNIIFNGTNLENGVYLLKAEVDPEHNVFLDTHPTTNVPVIMYDGENNIWKISKIS